MNKFRFLDWKVYKDSQDLFTSLLSLTKKIPAEYRYELSSQLIRSSSSVTLNIAEGSGKASDRELNRYFGIALGPYDPLRVSRFLGDRKNSVIVCVAVHGTTYAFLSAG